MHKIVIFWIISCIIIVTIYALLQILHTTDFWNNIGISPPPDQIEPFSSVGMMFFEVYLVVGWSIMTGIIIWMLISHISSFENRLITLISEMFQLWAFLFLVEVSLSFYDLIFSIIVLGSSFTFYIDVQMLLFIIWINLIFTCIFYTTLALEAIRKNIQMEKYITRVIYVLGEIIVIMIEGVLLFLPFGFLDFISFSANLSTMVNDILILGIYAVLFILTLMFILWIIKRIRLEEEKSPKEINFKILLLQLVLFYILFFIGFILLTFTSQLLVINPNSWIILQIFCVICSFLVVLFYNLLKELLPNQYKNVNYGIQLIKYHFTSFIANRGAMFNYPKPIDIFNGGSLTEVIESSWGQVTLKMACGQCYHVFKTQTSKNGSKVKPVPCPFCGSMATTPVWE